jgi:5-(carboxyamino)imidazole ribonucleotide synthase
MRVGILGGGQLARMLALAGLPLGLRFTVLDASADICAGDVADVLAGDFVDHACLSALAKLCDVLTFDFENVPASSVAFLQTQRDIHPNADVLAMTQDRLTEKAAFAALNVPVAPHCAVNSLAELTSATGQLGFPCVLKTRRLGYDGKGQYRLRGPGDVETAWRMMNDAPSILEAWIVFDRELSQVATRARDGCMVFYPLTQNVHRDGILALSLAPAKVSDALTHLAQTYARAMAEHYQYVGTFALEFFVVGEQLVLNEMAPRVHNSGHWTIDGAVTSQFENHLRAICNLPLGETTARGVSLMFNWIGEVPPLADVLCVPGFKQHDYGKQARAGRKVGHATLVAASFDQLQNSLNQMPAAVCTSEQRDYVRQKLLDIYL